MKTTIELPDDLLKEVKLLAVHEGRKLKDTVASLLRQGLAATTGERGSGEGLNDGLLEYRRNIAHKFVSGEWGLSLEGFEAGRDLDRCAADDRSTRWR